MTETLYRRIEFDPFGANEETHSAPCVLSSEFPVNRQGYREILSHAPGAVDLSRAPLPLLIGHDSQQLNVGLVEQVHLSGKKLRGTLRLGNTPRALELWSDIQAGILRNLSVGYTIENHIERGETITATRWTPHECSIVSVPADPSAGLYRGLTPMKNTPNNDEVESEESATPILDRLTRSQKRAESRLAQEERERVIAHYRFFDHMGLTAPEQLKFRDECINSGADIQIARDWSRSGQFMSEPIPFLSSREMQRHGYSQNTMTCHRPEMLRHFGPDHQTASDNAYRAGQWIRGALFGDHHARDWVQKRNMSTNFSAKGGALVPAELANSIISMTNEYGIARAHCRLWPMASDTLAIPKRRSGISGYYIAEGAQIQTSDMSLDQILLVSRKFAARILLSNELAEDAVMDVASLLAEECAREFARAEDEACFNGDATSTYGGMVGIRSALVGTAGVVNAAAGHDTFAEIDQTDLTALMAKLPAHARQGAKWFVNPEWNDTVFQRLALASTGVSMAEASGTRIENFRGYPIVPTEAMPAASAAGNGVICCLFGDLSHGVAFGDRRQFSVRTDDVSRMEFDQVVIQATERFDIVVHDAGTATIAGSVVGLALKT